MGEHISTTAVTDNSRLSIGNVRANVVGIDVKVPLLDGSHRTYVSFDNAASTPALRPVFDKVNEFLFWYSNVERGAGFKSQVSTRAYEQAHQIVCEFVGANPATHVAVFGKNSTEALNKLARRLPLSPDDVVLTTMMEHHSNDLPWRAIARLDRVSVDENGALDETHLEHLLQKYAGKVRLVTVTGASNVTGYLNPIHRIAARAHAFGAEILVDAAQLAAHRPVNMGADDDPGHIDYLAMSAHKMYAPFGTGALVGRKETFLQGDPDLVGGGTVDLVTVDEVKWTDLPEKEEAGTPNVVGAVALAKSILTRKEIGMLSIAQHEEKLTAYLLRGLLQIEGVRVFGIVDPSRASDKVGLVTFAVDGMSHNLVAAVLSAEGGIGVRNGCFCAHPYVLHLLKVPSDEASAFRMDIRRGVKANLPGLVRVSFGCYNDESEVDWFIEVLENVVRGKYRGHYVQNPATGAYRATDLAVDTADYFAL